jgi:hypothetical protein
MELRKKGEIEMVLSALSAWVLGHLKGGDNIWKSWLQQY